MKKLMLSRLIFCFTALLSLAWRGEKFSRQSFHGRIVWDRIGAFLQVNFLINGQSGTAVRSAALSICGGYEIIRILE